MDFEIVEATKEDAKDILALTKICGKETNYLSYGSEGIGLSLEQEMAFLDNVAHSLKDVFYVVKMKDEIVGMGSYTTFSSPRMSHRGEIGLCIRQSAWYLGIGHALMDRLLDFAKNQAKADLVSLEVCHDNRRAISLYQHYGFQKIGTFEGFFKIDSKLIDYDIMLLKLEKSS